ARRSDVTFDAASPTISRQRTSECISIRSASRSARDRPWANATASRAASSMWRTRVSSSTYIDRLGLVEDALPDVLAELVREAEVDIAAQEVGQVGLDAPPVQPEPHAGLHLEQDVDVALVVEVV